jgi:hypothetical protein
MAVHGAALRSRVEKQLREELSAYGLPMQEYTCEIGSFYEFDPELLMYATFTRKGNGAQIEIGGIFTNSRTGDITQRNMPELA